jgi:flagellar motor switch protein FliN
MSMLTQHEHTPLSVALPPARAVHWERFDDAPTANAASRETVALRIELGRTRFAAADLAALRKGTVVPLEQAADAPVDLYAAGQWIGRGEVVAVDGRFGVRVIELAKR